MWDGRLGSSWAALPDRDCVVLGPVSTDELLDNAIPLSPRLSLGGANGDIIGA